MPIQAAKSHAFGEFWPLNFTFYHRDPQKALPCAETRVLSPHWSWSVLRCDLDATRRVQIKERTNSKPKFATFADLFPLSHINQILQGHIPDIFLGFEFWEKSVENVGAVGVEFLAFPSTWHIAYTAACCYRTSQDSHFSFFPFTTLFTSFLPVLFFLFRPKTIVFGRTYVLLWFFFPFLVFLA